MKSFSIDFTRQARQDRRLIFAWVAANGSAEVARQFVQGLLDECASLQTAPMRGTLRMLHAEQVRVVGYRRAVSIVFTTEGDVVRILRLVYRGRDVQRASLR